ncbi:MAG: ApaG domain, partial [Burkholderiales bacterium]|nr:ApaG domain [Burkholderiales bacterium]
MSDKRYQFRVDVQAAYLPEQSKPEDAQYAFAYTVRVTNTGSVAAQLISRHWVIRDDSDRVI